MRQFLDRLPLVIQAKADPGRAGDAGARGKEIAQLLDATLQHRRVIMRYHSFSSDREKEYVIEPYRLVFAQGALYLVAARARVRRRCRTFALDRIKSLSVDGGSLRAGRARGGGVRALARRAPGRAAADRDRVRAADRALRPERVWHASQEVLEQPDGRVRVTLNVSQRLRAAQLDSGVRPACPRHRAGELAAQISDEIEETRRRYD